MSRILLRRAENVVAVAVSANGKQAERIDFLVEPLEEALMEEHRLTELGDLREGVTLSQDPLPQLFRLARLDAFREGQKGIDVERHQATSLPAQPSVRWEGLLTKVGEMPFRLGLRSDIDKVAEEFP
jgi:hypothetical protein